MIDWWSVFANSLWIGGVAAALAVLSYADWSAHNEGRDFHSTMRRLVSSSAFALSLALACAGGALSVSAGWQRWLWLLLAAGFSAQAVRCLLRKLEESRG
jgi:CubicO group peptidase (beta-lactamase class C family)